MIGQMRRHAEGRMPSPAAARPAPARAKPMGTATAGEDEWEEF